MSKLESRIPKNKRSKFVADLVARELNKNNLETEQEIHEFFDLLSQKATRKTNKTAAQLVREDRSSH